MTPRINETKSQFFEEINIIDESLSKLNKRWRENIQISKIRNKKGDRTIDIEEIQKITVHLKDYYLRYKLSPTITIL
jgi:sulfur relay (sulfurtransferase) DsrC/TusE family protein